MAAGAESIAATTAAYDSAIASTLERIPGFPVASRAKMNLSRKPCACLSRKPSTCDTAKTRTRKLLCIPTVLVEGVANAHQLQGKDFPQQRRRPAGPRGISRKEFDEPMCAIIKHTNPACAATGRTVAEAYKACPRMRWRLCIRG